MLTCLNPIRVLDPYRAGRWTLEGRPTETKTPAPPRSTRPSPASTFAASPAYPELRCDANSVRAMLPLLVPRAEGQAAELPKVPKEGPREAAHQLIDARGKVQYDGSEVRAQRGGRIPGAVNVPYKVLMDAERGGYLALDKVRDVLQARGVRVEAFDVSGSGASAAGGEVGCETILYCNGGVASTAVLFGMWQVGVPLRLLSNYDGSWGEWGNQCDAALFPVET
jgi:3-mercaptopyruvate sulfurtransferase SseA